MKVYLAPCGMGVGHVSRCRPIADSLIERGRSIAVSTYSSGLEYAQRLGYPTVQTVPLWLKADDLSGVDFKLTAATSPGFFRGLWSIISQIVAEIRNIRRFRPAVVVSDTRLSSLVAAKLLMVPSVVILNQFRVKIPRRPSKGSMRPLDKIFFVIANVVWWLVSVVVGWIWCLADMILIPDLPPPHTISSGNLAIPRNCASKVEFLGPLIKRPSRNPSKPTTRDQLGYNSNQPIILVALSVSPGEGRQFVGRVEKILENLPSRYQIVMSRGKVSGSLHAERKGNLTVYDWISNLDEYLEICDLVVGRAGQVTIMSSIAHGKPLLLIPVPDHPEQLGNARRALELGVANVLSVEELTMNSLASAIDRMLRSPEYRDRLAEIAEHAYRIGGLERAITIVEELSRKSGDLAKSA